MKALLPGCRFVVLLRDPVRRAISHYHHRAAINRDEAPLEATFAREFADPRARARARMTRPQRLAYLYAGLDGIKHRLEPGEPNLGNMYDLSPEEVRRRSIRVLPQSLSEALDELERDEVIQAGLGPIYPEFLWLKRLEWNDFHRQVSAWEVERYLTML